MRDQFLPVRDAQVVDLASSHEIIQSMHQFRDRGVVVPPVHVVEINVARLQVSQRILQRQTQALGTIAAKVGLNFDLLLVQAVWARVLGGDDKLVAVTPGGKPFAEPLLRLLGLVPTSRVEKVAAQLPKPVEDGKGCLLGALAHAMLVGLAKAHGAQTKGRDADICRRCQLPVTMQTRLWGVWEGERRCHDESRDGYSSIAVDEMLLRCSLEEVALGNSLHLILISSQNGIPPDIVAHDV